MRCPVTAAAGLHLQGGQAGKNPARAPSCLLLWPGHCSVVWLQAESLPHRTELPAQTEGGIRWSQRRQPLKVPLHQLKSISSEHSYSYRKN